MTPPAAPFTHAQYRAILEAALQAGYRFESFSDLPGVRGTGRRVCLLRHDCDNDMVAALRMAEIEAAAGVRSTYFFMLRSAMYNLLAPQLRRLARDIIRMGHWAGLHFDEWAVRELPVESVASEIARERAILATELGTSVDVVSFHQPGPRVLAGEIRPDCVNTYDREELAGFEYVADSNMNWRGRDPSEILAQGRFPRLQLLIHPEWWTPASVDAAAKWDLMLDHAFTLAERSLAAREAAYDARRVLLLRRGDPLPPLDARVIPDE